MYNNIIDNNCNSIFIKTNSKSKNKNRKINCVICFPKVQLDLVNEEECKWRCPRCKNDYQILEDGGDIVPDEDELMSSHESDDEGPVLLSSEEDGFKSDEDNNEESKSDIKIPKYMQDSETTTVTYFRQD
jgi:hypothetical protein